MLLRITIQGESERTCRSEDSGVKKVLLGVCDVEVELWNVEHVDKKSAGFATYWRRSVDDALKRRVRDHSFVECPFLSNVLDDSEVELVLAEIRVCLLDLVGLLLRANSCHYGVAAREERLQNVGSDKAAAALVGLLAVPMPLMIDVISSPVRSTRVMMIDISSNGLKIRVEVATQS